MSGETEAASDEAIGRRGDAVDARVAVPLRHDPRESRGPDLRQRLYEEVRRIARRGLRRERPDHTLQTTELAHEAMLRLDALAHEGGITESHFLAIAATTVRRVLVDHARRRRAARRGGSDGAGAEASVRVPLDATMLRLEGPSVEVLDLNHALDELKGLSSRAATVVEFRFFGGMSEEAVAEELAVSRATVARDWRWARAWLRRRLADGVATADDAGPPPEDARS